MLLYSTKLKIENEDISYNVFKEGDRLFFEPLKKPLNVDVCLFWVVKTVDVWQPLNIGDEEFIKRVQDDILKHDIE